MNTQKEKSNTSHYEVSYLNSLNLFNKLDLYFSTSASFKLSGVELITEIAPAWCKAPTASSEINVETCQ